jgi:hypothetical protein
MAPTSRSPDSTNTHVHSGLSIRFPVVCPACKQELLMEFNVADVAGALLDGSPLRLYATCHDQSWNATDVEVQQAREYLAACGWGQQREVQAEFSPSSQT